MRGVLSIKELGILGGMGPESTLLYYKEIAAGYKGKDKDGNFPALTIETANMYEMLGYCRAQQYDKLAGYLLRGIYNLEKAGTDPTTLASNTPHVVFDIIERQVYIPLPNIVGPTHQAVKAVGVKKVVWLGIGLTMEQEYSKRPFMEHGIDVVVPDEREQALIDKIIAKELEFGIVNEEPKKEIDIIIQRLIKEEGIEAAIMGYMKLPLMYTNEKSPVPVFDTLKYHIQGIVEYMFRE